LIHINRSPCQARCCCQRHNLLNSLLSPGP